MSRAVSAIAVGHPGDWRTVHTEGGYAVFARERGPGESDVYVIGRLPKKNEIRFQPASAIELFSSGADAIESLKRWATDPLPPAPTPKVRKPGLRRNSNRQRKDGVGLGQLELDLKYGATPVSRTLD
jgi:hypothetical protein